MAGARGVVVDLIANVADFIRGTDKVDTALAEVSDSLDTVARDGEQAAEKLERSFSEAARKIDDDTSKNLKSGKMKDVGSEVGSEFAQNFGEAVRGGNPAQAITETVTSLGPAFGLAGVAAAAGAGLVLSFINGAAERAAEVKAMAAGLYEAYRDGFLDAAEKETLLIDALGVDSIDEAYRQIASMARSTGVSSNDLIRIIEGGVTDADELNSIVQAARDAVDGRGPARNVPSESTLSGQMNLAARDAERVQTAAEKSRDAMNAAAEAQRVALQRLEAQFNLAFKAGTASRQQVNAEIAEARINQVR
jgi:hypothetical protein